MKEQLMAEARQARLASYSPYSHFAVGAALLCVDGSIIRGCNVENASYGLTLCAERNAIFQAVAQGKRAFKALAIAGNGTNPVFPCGACLQVMAEFAPEMTLFLGSADGKDIITTSVQALLPAQFALAKEDAP